MSKAHRGKVLRDKPYSGRGDCPICKRTGVKLLYEKEINGAKLNICKICKSVLAKKPA